MLSAPSPFLLLLIGCSPTLPEPSPPVVIHETAPMHTCAAASSSDVVLDLSGPELMGGDPVRVHGGRLLSASRTVEAKAPVRPGRWRVEVSAATSAFDGEPGELSIELDGEPVAVLEVPEGPSQVLTVEFETQRAGWLPLRVRFANDAYDGPLRDRNVEVSRLRLTRLEDFLTPAERRRALLEQLKGANLLLVSIDTLRADHLSAYGYGRDTSPTIDRLAQHGVRFDNAISASHWTAPSHTTLLTGLHPREHGVVDYPNPKALGDEALTLAEQLGQSGYQTAGFVGGIYVSEHLGLSQGFDHWQEGRPRAEGTFPPAGDWLVARESDAPFFAFLHTYEVHEPYDPPEPWDGMYVGDRPSFGKEILRKRLADSFFDNRLPNPDELAVQVGLYDGGIRYTDHMLGKLMARLDTHQISAHTLVVITSDHGEEFLEHGGMGHGRLFAEHIRVPLVLQHPALRVWGLDTVTEVTGGVDVFPTLAELLSVPLPDGLSGRSSVPALLGERCDADSRAWSSAQQSGVVRTSVIDERAHYITEDTRPFFFRVDVDRAETLDLAATADTSSHAEALTSWTDGLSLRHATSKATYTDADLEAMRALGYAD